MHRRLPLLSRRGVRMRVLLLLLLLLLLLRWRRWWWWVLWVMWVVWVLCVLLLLWQQGHSDGCKAWRRRRYRRVLLLTQWRKATGHPATSGMPSMRSALPMKGLHHRLGGSGCCERYSRRGARSAAARSAAARTAAARSAAAAAAAAAIAAPSPSGGVIRPCRRRMDLLVARLPEVLSPRLRAAAALLLWRAPACGGARRLPCLPPPARALALLPQRARPRRQVRQPAALAVVGRRRVEGRRERGGAALRHVQQQLGVRVDVALPRDVLGGQAEPLDPALDADARGLGKVRVRVLDAQQHAVQLVIQLQRLCHGGK